MLADRLAMYRRDLEGHKNFDNWSEGFEELQRANIAKNIAYLEEKIRDTEAEMERSVG
jgi:hypothetical protein